MIFIWKKKKKKEKKKAGNKFSYSEKEVLPECFQKYQLLACMFSDLVVKT